MSRYYSQILVRRCLHCLRPIHWVSQASGSALTAAHRRRYVR